MGWGVAIDFVQESSKSKRSSRLFKVLEVRKFHMTFLGEFRLSYQDLCGSDYDSPKSQDDRVISPKKWHVQCWLLEHKQCPVCNTGNVLLGTHGTSCVQHTECPACNMRNVL